MANKTPIKRKTCDFSVFVEYVEVTHEVHGYTRPLGTHLCAHATVQVPLAHSHCKISAFNLLQRHFLVAKQPLLKVLPQAGFEYSFSKQYFNSLS